MKISFILLSLFLFSCGTKTDELNQGNLKKLELKKSNLENDIFRKKVIVILSKELNNDSNNINIQDYVENDVSFIPIFSSIDNFNKSTKGEIKNPKIEIDGIFLLSILNGNENLRLNPSLEDEVYFSSKDLLKKYSKEIAQLNLDLKK